MQPKILNAILLLVILISPVSAAWTYVNYGPFYYDVDTSAPIVYPNGVTSGAQAVAFCGAGNVDNGWQYGWATTATLQLPPIGAQFWNASTQTGFGNSAVMNAGTTIPAGKNLAYAEFYCQYNTGNYVEYQNMYISNQYMASLGLTPTFTGTPISGFNPLNVTFTPQYFSNTSSILWTFGDGQSYTSLNSTAVSHIYVNPGTYSVTMRYSASNGTPFEVTRPNYIVTSITTGLTFNLDVKDSISGAILQDVDIGIKNTTSGIWRNRTAPTGLVYYDTTDPGYLYPLSQNQTVTVAGGKTGYKNASITFAIPYNNYRAYLNLVPTSVINATGTGTLVVSAIMNKNGIPLPGTSITLDTGQMGSTNSAGAYTFRNVTAGTRSAVAAYSGYQTISQTTALAAGETKMITMQMILDGQTPVPTYGSPTPTGTPGPGDPGYAGVNTSAGALNERGSTGLMEMMGMIIQLWPLILIILFMKFMKDAFS